MSYSLKEILIYDFRIITKNLDSGFEKGKRDHLIPPASVQPGVNTVKLYFLFAVRTQKPISTKRWQNK